MCHDLPLLTLPISIKQLMLLSNCNIYGTLLMALEMYGPNFLLHRCCRIGDICVFKLSNVLCCKDNPYYFIQF